ncbi:Non-histone chromosomal protein 6 [Rhynchospora pubera]|uniref:Non-histone chromosomal protein 6 n=1 Tax=Rhynchospora pubera TaxID=906938 RepID=A0AAV8DQ73_9POAL|nr:Non-histone chromosomal protein 6 [Rhynchospora pubera]
MPVTVEKMPKKDATSVKPSSSKRKMKDGDEEGSKKRPKKKKDPNAPKRGMTAFINPGLSFTEVGKALGEKWKKMSSEEKEPYEALAKADSKRYREQMDGYKRGAATNADSGSDSDWSTIYELLL